MNKNHYDIDQMKKAVDIVGSVARLAGIVEVSGTTVYSWLWGKSIPDPINCLKIQKATKGQVRARDIRPDYEWDKVLPAE